ncbi:MAG: hypothetical protein PHQ36_07320, partial [Anaerolineales bacterium]|nr:hypothetical protein [Anaerolineales bacterium]
MSHARIYLMVAALALLAVSCVIPALPMNEDVFNTAVAQTVNAGLTQNYVSPTWTPTPTITFTPTLTSEPQTLAAVFTETVTPTLAFTPTATDTPTVPLPEISVSVNTNCRSGPGKVYEIEGALLVGKSAPIYGVDSTGQYWYIRNPDPGAEYCWLSGKYATVEGATSLVPVMTPPPTATATVTPLPVPDFRASYSNTDGCGNWWLELLLYNSGKAVFKSVAVTVKDTYKGGTFSKFTNGFINIEGCDSV